MYSSVPSSKYWVKTALHCKTLTESYEKAKCVKFSSGAYQQKFSVITAEIIRYQVQNVPSKLLGLCASKKGKLVLSL